MNARIFSRLLIVTAALALLLAAPAAQAQKPPKGDDVDKPVNVPLNGKKTVKNIENATEEIAAVEEASCDGDDSSDHSVWFRFTLPVGGIVDVDAGGALIRSDNGSHSFVVLSLYQDNPARTEINCVVSSAARLTEQNLAAGAYLVRIASDSVNEPSGPSQYRLSVRARSLAGMLADHDFENEPLGVHWKAKKPGNPTGDITRVCSGGCHVRFGGVAKGKVLQTVAYPKSVIKFKAGDIVNVNLQVNNTGVAGADVRVILHISYTNGKPATKVKATRRVIQASTASWTFFGAVLAEVEYAAVKQIKVTVMSPKASDTFSIDNVDLTLRAGSSVRQPLVPAGALPLPAPAQ